MILGWFGVKYSRLFGLLHLIYSSAGNWLTFLPQFFLGFSGMPRRIHDYPIVFTGWHSMSSAGHFVTIIGIAFFYLALLDAHIEKKIMVETLLKKIMVETLINYLRSNILNVIRRKI
jgi:heme/copper-type cytochrome/quinol oxidase subunit 1